MLDITRENALKLHRQMWSDMQRDLGDCPSSNDRLKYKEQWCREHFGNIFIVNDCFLCEYVEGIDSDADCEDACPIKWIDGSCMSDDPANNYETMPISKLLALPEREFNEVN